MTENELLNLFGEEFADILDALESGMPGAMEDLMVSVFSKVQFDTQVFGARLTQQVEGLLAQGVAMSAIEANLKNDMLASGRIFGEMKNSIAAGISEMINQSGRLGQLDQYGDKYREFAWITVGGHKICPDCEGRIGQVLTWDEWETEGLPGSGWSACRGYCYCVLDPTGTLSKKIDAPANIKEKNYTT
tara:strand:- start:1350 stop:1916 length:567 start_codon:yes stop_codon:yes gene_type:complete